MGCLLGQGYYFSRPLAPGDLTTVLTSGAFTFGEQLSR
jgi:EAL domain-containing protein (putative c-di-GMP-specific phosphodiesterase class I)